MSERSDKASVRRERRKSTGEPGWHIKEIDNSKDRYGNCICRSNADLMSVGAGIFSGMDDNGETRGG